MNLAVMRERLDYQSLLLGLVVMVTCALLAVAYQLTREPIQQALAKDMRQSFSQVLPEHLYDNDLLDHAGQIEAPWGSLTYYQASLAGDISAVVFPMRASGYAGKIEMLVAIKANGELSGVRVLVHQETPGLGDKIEVARDPWITYFTGKSLHNPLPTGWAVKKDGGEFDQFTGATITPRAIVAEIKRALLFFEAEQPTLLYPLKLPEQTVSAVTRVQGVENHD